jgi:hypothetical protein
MKTSWECEEVSVVLLCVVVGLLWPVPVGFDDSGSFPFLHKYYCVCSLVQNLTSLAYKLRTRSVQVLHNKLVSKLLKNWTCIQVVGVYLGTCDFSYWCIQAAEKLNL